MLAGKPSKPRSQVVKVADGATRVRLSFAEQEAECRHIEGHGTKWVVGPAMDASAVRGVIGTAAAAAIRITSACRKSAEEGVEEHVVAFAVLPLEDR